MSLSDLPNDWKTPAIGTPAEVRTLLERAFPGQQHTDDQTCVIGEMFWIEFNYRAVIENGMVESVGIRSNVGPGAMDIMKRACEVLNVKMIDCQTSEIADLSEQTESSMNRFTVWWDRVIDQIDEESL